MPQETIVFTQGGELPADLLTQAQAMKPPGFTLHVLPADASAEDIAAAMQEAEYLMGFVRSCRIRPMPARHGCDWCRC